MSFAPALPLPNPLPFLPPRIPGGLIADPALRALTRADVIAYWAHVLRVSAGQWFPKPPATPAFLVGPTLAALAGILLFPQRTADGTLPDYIEPVVIEPGIEPPPLPWDAPTTYFFNGPDNPDDENLLVEYFETSTASAYTVFSGETGNKIYEYPGHSYPNERRTTQTTSGFAWRGTPKTYKKVLGEGEIVRDYWVEYKKTSKYDDGSEWIKAGEFTTLEYSATEYTTTQQLSASLETVSIDGVSQPLTPEPRRQPKPRPTPITPQPLTTTMTFPGAPILAPGPAPVPINPTPIQPEPAPVQPQPIPAPTPIPLPGIAPGPAPVPIKVTPTLPSGVPAPPAPAPVVPTPNDLHFPVSGDPGISPAGAKASIASIAKEVGRIEGKASKTMNGLRDAFNLLDGLDDLLDWIERLQNLFEQPYPSATYSIQGVCEEVSEDNPGQPQTSVILPEQKWADRLIETPAILETLLQAHLGYKTPICGSTNEKPILEGQWVSTHWVSDGRSDNGTKPLRKLFRYRTKSSRTQDELRTFWAGLTWQAGPTLVQHKGAWWGTPAVWALNAEEGKRVLRFAGGEAGIDPDLDGEWIVGGSRSPRYGMKGTMRLAKPHGEYWVTSRDSPSGLPDL